MTDLIEILEKLYKHEINWEIDCFYDNGFTARLGDKMNGYTWRGCGFNTLEDAIIALIKAATGLWKK